MLIKNLTLSLRQLWMLIFLTFLFNCSCNTKEKKNQTNTGTAVDGCYNARLIVDKDYKTGELKYYVCGMTLPSKKYIDSFKTFNVTVIGLGCVKDTLHNCYNQLVDSIIFSKYKVKTKTIRM